MGTKGVSYPVEVKEKVPTDVTLSGNNTNKNTAIS